MSWTRGNRTRWDIQQDFVNNSWSVLSCSLRSFQTYSTSKNGEPIRCNVTWDGLSCWPSVPAGLVAEISCFPELKGIRYNTSENATRLCYENGTWANRSDYSKCNPLISEDEFLEVLWDVKEATRIYYIGYGISLLASLVALTIFVYFKDLRCLRNVIHTNLIVTYILLDMTWIITANFQLLPNHTVAGTRAACVLVIFLTYLLGTNFFWMFVEGLYLYVLVVKTFSFEIFKVQIYAFVGWGLPAIVVLIWALSKAYFSPLPSDTFLLVRCQWQIRDSYDYIFIVPVIVVLLINVFFLGQIMWVLITKLRAANTIEQKQYRKAAKALLVLIPLLGVTYVLVIVTPTHKTARVVFTYIQATLLSTQGLTVSILYCFLNGEVRNTLHQHLGRWRTSRSLGIYSTRCTFSHNRNSPGFNARERVNVDWAQNRKNTCYTTDIGGACTPGNSNEEAV